MIRTLRKQGRDIPMLICDVCESWIEGAGEAAAVWRTASADGEISAVLHVHKRGCHAQAELHLGGDQYCSWEELGTHLLYLTSNTGLSPMELQELEDRNSRFGL